MSNNDPLQKTIEAEIIPDNSESTEYSLHQSVKQSPRLDKSPRPEACYRTNPVDDTAFPQYGFEIFLEKIFKAPRWADVLLREIIAVILGVICIDFFCYCAVKVINIGALDERFFSRFCIVWGNSSFAAFLFVMPIIVWLAAVNKRLSASRIILTILVWLTAAKLVYFGRPGTVICGIGLLIFLAAIGTNVQLQIVDFCRYVVSSVCFGGKRILDYFSVLSDKFFGFRLGKWSEIVFPLLAVVVFGAIFILASPDLVRIWNNISNWICHLFEPLPSLNRVLLWLISFWFLAGFLAARYFTPLQEDEQYTESASAKPSVYFDSFRNTLIAVSTLFALYLGHELYTFIQNDFPAGFDYGTYSHLGAAWLTFALFLSTILLWLIFRPSVYNNSRVFVLRAWATFWAMENFLLAAAVYYRLWLYIAKNGLTSLRVVGLLGTTAVVFGLIWVLIWLRNRYSFFWLIRQYAVTVMAIVLIFETMPVQALVYQYNCNRICAGDYAPCLHLKYQRISTEGWLQLFPLLNSKNPVIRNGVAALLYEKAFILQERQKGLQTDFGKAYSTEKWRFYNFVDDAFLKQAEYYHTALEPYYVNEKREQAIHQLLILGNKYY